MRKNDARKWLHAALDLLPVILIPVFMIYSHRHDITSGVPVVDSDVVRKYTTNEVSTYDDLVNGNYYYFNFKYVRDNGWSSVLTGGDSVKQHYVDLGYSSTIPFNNTLQFSNTPMATTNIVHFYDLNCYSYGFSGSFSSNSFCYDTLNLPNHYVAGFWIEASSTGSVSLVFNEAEKFDYTYNNQTYTYTKTYSPSVSVCYLLDLNFVVQVNDVSNNDFRTYYTKIVNSGLLGAVPDSANPIISADVNIDYEDSTITNVFLDNFCNTIDTYFNFGNVFNLGNVYSWVETNIFNGSAPQIVPAIWNIAVYEFVMDLIFLLYALFMFFIDFCVNLVDRFHTKCSGGK